MRAHTNTTTPTLVAHVLSGGEVIIPAAAPGRTGRSRGLCTLPAEDGASPAGGPSPANGPSPAIYYSCRDVGTHEPPMGRAQAQGLGLGYRSGLSQPEWLYVPSRRALLPHTSTTSWADRTNAIEWAIA